MDLDQEPAVGERVLVVQAPRRWTHRVRGYVLPGSVVVAAVAAGVVMVGGGVSLLSVVTAAWAFPVVWFWAYVPYYFVMAKRLQGRDNGAGLPLAELSETGVRL